MIAAFKASRDDGGEILEGTEFGMGHLKEEHKSRSFDGLRLVEVMREVRAPFPFRREQAAAIFPTPQPRLHTPSNLFLRRLDSTSVLIIRSTPLAAACLPSSVAGLRSCEVVCGDGFSLESAAATPCSSFGCGEGTRAEVEGIDSIPNSDGRCPVVNDMESQVQEVV